MKINLIEEKENPELLAFNTGDILVFYSDEDIDYDYSMVIYDRGKYKLLSLLDFVVEEEFEILGDMIITLNSTENNYNLIEVIKSEDVELRRTLNG